MKISQLSLSNSTYSNYINIYILIYNFINFLLICIILVDAGFIETSWLSNDLHSIQIKKYKKVMFFFYLFYNNNIFFNN